jgi:hypothetical protein
VATDSVLKLFVQVIGNAVWVLAKRRFGFLKRRKKKLKRRLIFANPYKAYYILRTTLSQSRLLEMFGRLVLSEKPVTVVIPLCAMML